MTLPTAPIPQYGAPTKDTGGKDRTQSLKKNPDKRHYDVSHSSLHLEPQLLPLGSVHPLRLRERPVRWRRDVRADEDCTLISKLPGSPGT